MVNITVVVVGKLSRNALNFIAIYATIFEIGFGQNYYGQPNYPNNNGYKPKPKPPVPSPPAQRPVSPASPPVASGGCK